MYPILPFLNNRKTFSVASIFSILYQIQYLISAQVSHSLPVLSLHILMMFELLGLFIMYVSALSCHPTF